VLNGGLRAMLQSHDDLPASTFRAGPRSIRALGSPSCVRGCSFQRSVEACAKLEGANMAMSFAAQAPRGGLTTANVGRRRELDAVTTSDSGSLASMTACKATAATGETTVPGWAFKTMTAPPRRRVASHLGKPAEACTGGLLRGCGQGGPSLLTIARFCPCARAIGSPARAKADPGHDRGLAVQSQAVASLPNPRGEVQAASPGTNGETRRATGLV